MSEQDRPWRSPGVPTPEFEALAVVLLDPQIQQDAHPRVLQAIYESGGRFEDAFTVLLDLGLSDAEIWRGEWLKQFDITFRRSKVELLAALRIKHRAIERERRRRRARGTLLPDPEPVIKEAIAALVRDRTTITLESVATRIAHDNQQLDGYAVSTLQRDLGRHSLPKLTDPSWRVRK